MSERFLGVARLPNGLAIAMALAPLHGAEGSHGAIGNLLSGIIAALNPG